MSRLFARRSLRPWFLLVGVALALAACAGGQAATNGPADGELMQSRAGAALPAASAAPSMGGAILAPAAAGEPVTGGGKTVSDPNAQLIVKNGTLSIQVGKLDTALAAAQSAITGLGGYVSDSQRSNAGDQSTAQVTYRIPAAKWDAALDALHKIASKIVTEQTTAVEVTGQVLDLGARITNLQVTEQALQAIMARATKIQDVLDVQTQLTDVRGQIEELQTETAHLEKQAALGTLMVSFSLPVTPIAAVTTGWDPGSDLDRAVAQLVSIGQGLLTDAVWFVVVWVPVLVGLGVVALVASLVARALRRSGRLPRIRRGAPPVGPAGTPPDAVTPLA